MGIFKPNVEKMAGKRNVNGLMDALTYKKDWQVREAAAVALGEIGDPGAVGALVDALSDTPPVRQAAVHSLAGYKDIHNIKPILASLNYDSSEQFQTEVAQALILLGSPAIETLLSLLPLEQRSMRGRIIVRVLAQIGDERVVQPIIDTLKVNYLHQDAENALQELGMISVDPLIAALDDADIQVRNSAAHVLSSLRWKSDDPTLLAKYYVALEDWKQCVKLGAPSVIPLMNVFTDENATNLLEAVGSTLSRIGSPALNPLISCLQHKNEKIRQAAAKSLGQIGDLSAVVPLIQMLKRDSVYDRAAARSALVKIGPSGKDNLVSALHNDNEKIRKEVLGILDKIHWNPENPQQKAWYHIARKEWGKTVELGSVAVEPLIASLKGGNKSEIIFALEKIGDESAVS
jgi:HEAT repeat protein